MSVIIHSDTITFAIGCIQSGTLKWFRAYMRISTEHFPWLGPEVKKKCSQDTSTSRGLFSYLNLPEYKKNHILRWPHLYLEQLTYFKWDFSGGSRMNPIINTWNVLNTNEVIAKCVFSIFLVFVMVQL